MQVNIIRLGGGLLMDSNSGSELRAVFVQVGNTEGYGCILCRGDKIVALWLRPGAPSWVDAEWAASDVFSGGKLRNAEKLISDNWPR